MIIRRAVTALFLSLTLGCADSAPTPEEARDIAREAWVYGFPMVMNYKTMYAYVVDSDGPEYKGPFNYMGCEARVYTPEDRAIVTPNSDTPYCMGWVDLRAEPIVLRVPELDEGRYYSVQLIDLYTHNFAYVGSLTTGSSAGAHLLTGPGWSGDVPAGVDQVIPVETDFFFSIIRTQVFGPDDIERVAEIQAGYAFEPLSSFLGEEPLAAAPLPDFPAWREGDQFTAGALEYIDFMLDLVAVPENETALMNRLATIGLGTSEPFELSEFSPEMREAFELGIEDGRSEVEAFLAENSADPLASARIFGTRAFLEQSASEHYGLDTPYLLRTVGANAGLYGNSGAEATYPTYYVDSEGQPLDGSKGGYEMRFPEGALPPVDAFWSLTMYDGPTQLLIENPIDRYLLNSTMLDQFDRSPDGSLTLYFQRDAPGAALESNWLPAPDGPFYVTMRLYGPQATVLDGVWTPPPLVPTGDREQ